MLHIVIAIAFLLVLLLLLFLSVFYGRKFGRWRIEHATQKTLGIVNVAEGAVFALLGLLVAFTFSGAYDRFEMRKLHIIDEANAYSTAYMRIDLLAQNTRAEIRQNIRAYLDAHLEAYKKIPHMNEVHNQLQIAQQLEDKIWNQVITACNITHNDSATQLVIPAINEMFDKANKGFDISLIHSPIIIFVLLIGLAAIGSFLTGYSTAESESHSVIHIVSYLFIVTSTIFLILNMELPRMGIVRVNSFDHILVDVEKHWVPNENSMGE